LFVSQTLLPTRAAFDEIRRALTSLNDCHR
jgi:hypothetical protein